MFFQDRNDHSYHFNGSAAYLVSRDITDERAAQENHREQAAVLNWVREAIVVRDLDNVIRFGIRATTRLYGWISDEAIGPARESPLSTR